MNNINTSGLERFIEKINKIIKDPDLSWLHEKVAKIGVEEFSNAYNENMSFGILDIRSEIVEAKNGKVVRILAIDDNQKTLIAFLEFGTGAYVPEYQGKKPSQAITFTTSDGVTHTTQGWKYYYKPSIFKDNIGGVDGWFFGSTFTDGKQTLNTQNTFYRACQKIRERLSKELI